MNHLMKFRKRWPLAAAYSLLALFMLLAAVSDAYAHVSRTVGPYTFVVGFSSEPAIEGQPNGVSLQVTEGEGDSATPVEGLEETLEVEATHVGSGVSEVMALRPAFGDPGHYINNWIPTAPGQYTFRFFGAVGDMAVDELFESGPETFSSVEPAEELHFPEPVPAAAELEGAVRGAQSSADEALSATLVAEEQLSTVRTLAVVAVVLGALGLLMGAAAFVSARRS